MKRSITVYSLMILTGVLFNVSTVKADPLSEKQKIIHKSYPVKTGDELVLNNKFGEIQVKTWEKNEVGIKVTVTAKARLNKDADYLLNHIGIASEKKLTIITCNTYLSKELGGKEKQDLNRQFSIQYEVSLPATMRLTVRNEYGNTSIPEFQGPVFIQILHGILNTGELRNVKNIEIEYSKAKLAGVNGGKIAVKYSTVEIKKMSGTISASFDFADSISLSLNDSIQRMSIQNTYSDLYLRLSRNFSGAIALSSQLNPVFNRTTKQLLNDSSRGKVTDHERNGDLVKRYKLIAGSGLADVSVQTKYGKLTLLDHYSQDSLRRERLNDRKEKTKLHEKVKTNHDSLRNKQGLSADSARHAEKIKLKKPKNKN